MIQTIKQLWKQYSEGRSSKWPALRRQVIFEMKRCEACGTIKNLEVHHIVPFSHNPHLELVRENLIVLCEDRGCHHRIGHSFDWKAANSYVREDAAIQLERIKWRVTKTVFFIPSADDV